MKTFLVLILTCIAVSGLSAQMTYVPDDKFEQALIDLGYDTPPLNDSVPTKNIDTVTFLNVSNKYISDLAGVEDFRALTGLYCRENTLTSLEVSHNSALIELVCSHNLLTSLDVSKNINLTYLNCYWNELTSLDLTKNTELNHLDCHSNYLTSLDVSKNSALTVLSCYNNPNLYCIQVSDSTKSEKDIQWKKDPIAIWSEDCENASINIRQTYVPDDIFERSLIHQGYDTFPLNDSVPTKNIDTVTYLGVSFGVSNLTGIEDFIALKYLNCGMNTLTSLDVSKNTALTELNCSENNLTSLDVSGCIALTYLDCSSNKLTSLDVSKNIALTELWCYSNALTNLDVSGCFPLTILGCYGNQLTNLDVTKNTELAELYCYINELTNLDISKNISLTELDCWTNQLTNLDISKNTALRRLHCPNNKLDSLDLSYNIELKWLYCFGNDLTSLDVSKNNALTRLYCFDNVLTSLDVSKNTALFELSCEANPNLYCIQVSDSAKVNNKAGWKKDPHAVWSEDCSLVSVEEETNAGNDITLYPNPAGDYVEINNVILNEVKDPVIVYDLLGIKCMDELRWSVDTRLRGNDIFVSDEGNVKINVSQLGPGVYFVRIGSYFTKFVKM